MPNENFIPPEHKQEINALIADPKMQEQFLGFLGREPNYTANKQPIYHLSSGPLNFEWHTQTRKLYLIREDHVKKINYGEMVATNVETHGDAWNYALVFCRGYDEGKRPDTPKENRTEGSV